MICYLVNKFKENNHIYKKSIGNVFYKGTTRLKNIRSSSFIIIRLVGKDIT